MAKETKFEEKKKLFLNKIEVFNFDVNKKKVDTDTLMYQNIRDTLSKSFYVELKERLSLKLSLFLQYQYFIVFFRIKKKFYCFILSIMLK